MTSVASIALSVVGAYSVFWVLRAVYRLYFHPLSHYPGPKLAAISKPWYEWYWNFYQNGMLLFEIERLHQRLGPVIRIAPNELHINDPEVFLEMTKVGSSFTKDPGFYDFITFPGTSIGETDPVRHRIRRQVLTPAFSPARVQEELAPMVKNKADHLMHRFEEFAVRGEPVNIFRATKAFTMDVISTIVFGKELGCIANPDFRNKFIEYLHSTFEMGWTATAFPNLTRFSLSLPEWLSEKLFPIPIMEFKKKCIGLMDSYLRERDAPTINSQDTPSGRKNFNQSVVIDLLVDPASAKDHSVLNASQLAEEVIVLLSAGNDTTSNSMIIGIYQVLRHPDVYERITKELITAFPRTEEGITYDQARKLPYLTAVIKEILRYSSPLPGKAPRVVPPAGWTLYGKKVPAKTIICTSSHLLNRHAGIWSEPDRFLPDRWLVPDSSHLEKYMTSFYRGSRQCLGKDLAYCEMCTLLANMFRRFELEIYNTTDADMEWIDLLMTFFLGRNFHAKVKVRADSD